MAGSPERPEKGIPERFRDVMVRFEVDEKGCYSPCLVIVL
jgi:hypothetical protein